MNIFSDKYCRILTVVVCFLLALMPCDLFAKKSYRKGILTANSAVVMDLNRNRILFARNAHARFIPASTVKVMTALVVVENISLDREIVVSNFAASMQPSKVYLSGGQRYRIYDLLSASLMSSANDATVALAEAACGSEKVFVALMNKKAGQLGMRDTNFINCTGLPVKSGNQFSSAYDLAVLMEKAAQNPIILSLLSKPTAAICGSDGKSIRLVNHNKLLFKNKERNILLKTGYTLRSRHCFVGLKMCKNKTYIFAFLKSRRPWDDLAYLLRNKS